MSSTTGWWSTPLRGLSLLASRPGEAPNWRAVRDEVFATRDLGPTSPIYLYFRAGKCHSGGDSKLRRGMLSAGLSRARGQSDSCSGSKPISPTRSVQRPCRRPLRDRSHCAAACAKISPCHYRRHARSWTSGGLRERLSAHDRAVCDRKVCPCGRDACLGAGLVWLQSRMVRARSDKCHARRRRSRGARRCTD